MHYELSIEDNSEKKIEISVDGIITNVKVVLSQNDDNSKSSSERMNANVSILGMIKNESLNQTKEILNWSKTTVTEQMYKSIIIRVYKDKNKKEGSLIRDFYFQEMYCFSYEEHFESGSNDIYGTFCLNLKQVNGKVDTIVVE